MEGRREEGGGREGRREKEERADSLARMDPCCLGRFSASANPNGTWDWD